MHNEQHNTVVGFVGLGTMGDPMARNIAKAGYDVRLYDVDLDRAQRLAEQMGATALSAPAGLAQCDAVVFMLPTSRIVRSVLFSDEGELRIPLTSKTILIDMSSSDPNETLETGRLLAAHGVSLVDAPVSGARTRAEDGTLSIMLGSDDDEAAKRAEPIIRAMSQQIFRTGALGTGHAMKALNNFVAAAAYTASAEALIAGERFGLDPQVMVDIFNASTGQSFVTTHVLGEHIVQGKFATGFALPLMTKDVGIALALQKSVHHSAPVCEAVTAALGDALEAMGNVDHARAFQFWEKR
ncbi:NAD(P)-dependent oxidoreductase [Arthrobacter koreensis]|uniref:NAD(P)-dependent oxidoreductase n=1 Tax=Arthrobacter koreensis TaxID=199136 RepID=UPI0037F4C8DF